MAEQLSSYRPPSFIVFRIFIVVKGNVENDDHPSIHRPYENRLILAKTYRWYRSRVWLIKTDWQITRSHFGNQLLSVMNQFGTFSTKLRFSRTTSSSTPGRIIFLFPLLFFLSFFFLCLLLSFCFSSFFESSRDIKVFEKIDRSSEQASERQITNVSFFVVNRRTDTVENFLNVLLNESDLPV